MTQIGEDNMGFLDKIKDAINPLDGVFKGVQDIIGKFKLPPEEKRNFDLEITRLELEEKQKLRESELKLASAYLADAANLREQVKVELASEDAFVRRARPAWLWGLLIMYLLNYGVGGVVTMFHTFTPLDIPWEVHMLAGSLVAGYAYLRTLEKSGANPPFSK